MKKKIISFDIDFSGYKADFFSGYKVMTVNVR